MFLRICSIICVVHGAYNGKAENIVDCAGLVKAIAGGQDLLPHLQVSRCGSMTSWNG